MLHCSHHLPYATGPSNLPIAWYLTFIKSCEDPPQYEIVDDDEDVVIELAPSPPPLPVDGGKLAVVCVFASHCCSLAFAAVSPMARVYAELRNHTTKASEKTLVIRKSGLVHGLRPSASAARSNAHTTQAQLSAWWRRKFDFPLALDGDNLSGTVTLTTPVFRGLVSLHLSEQVTSVDVTASVLEGIQELYLYSHTLRGLRVRVTDFKSLQVLTVHDFTEEDFAFASQLSALTEVSLYGGSTESLDMRQFVAAATLERLVIESQALTSLLGLARCVSLEAVTFLDCFSLMDLSAAAGLKSLKSFDASASDAADITWLSECHLLEELKLAYCPAITNLSPLRGLIHLKVLDISDGDVRSISELSCCAALETLDISYCLEISDIAPLSQLTFLKEIKAHYCGVRNLGAKGKWHALEMVDVSYCRELRSLAGLEAAPQLRVIKAWSSGVEDIRGLSHCPLLEIVNFLRCVRLTSLAPLAAAPCLRIIDAGESGISDIGGLGQCPQLRKVDFRHCVSLYDISSLTGAAELTHVIASESSVRNITGLNTCPMLAVCDFDCCKNLESLSPLTGAPQLHTIIASHSGVQTIAGLHKCPVLRTLDLLLCHELKEDVATEFSTHRRVTPGFL